MSDDCVPFVRMEVTGVDDPEAGMGIVLYVAGCPRRCPGCQNPSLQLTGNYAFIPVAAVVDYMDRFLEGKRVGKLIESVIFQGGDWAEYPEAYVVLARVARGRNYRTVLYTGEYFENLPETVREVSDWVVDGPWEQDKPALFPPSSNQRVFKRGRAVDPERLPLHKHLLGLVREA